MGRDRLRDLRGPGVPGAGGTRLICALIVDPADAPDFPEGEAEVLGRPLCAYPLIAAKRARHIGRVYALPSSAALRRAAAQYGAAVLDAPRAPEGGRLSEGELLLSAYRQAAEDLKAEGSPFELAVLLFANAGAVNALHIDQGVEALLEDPSLDSAATVSCYPRWAPRRAMREEEGRLVPYAAGAPDGAEPWFPDWGAQILRPRVLDALPPGPPELSWLGRKILPLKQAGGGPVDYQWQVPKLEYWLKKQGFSESPRPEPQPKLQPKPQSSPRTERR